jgi:hypothetical protein
MEDPLSEIGAVIHPNTWTRMGRRSAMMAKNKPVGALAPTFGRSSWHVVYQSSPTFAKINSTLVLGLEHQQVDPLLTLPIWPNLSFVKRISSTFLPQTIRDNYKYIRTCSH